MPNILRLLLFLVFGKWQKARCLWYFQFSARKRRLNKIFQETLPAYARRGTPAATLERYTVKFRRHFGTGHRPFFGRLYWDASFGIALSIDERVIAIIGFSPIEDAVIIPQIQGVRGNERELSHTLRWERLLIDLLTRVTRNSGAYKEIRMISATQSFWYQYGDLGKRMARRYDGTAFDMGFWWHPAGYYVRELDG